MLCAVVLLVSPGLGCGEEMEPGGTLGDEERVYFTFQRSCFFGCPLEQPLLVGTRETIDVSEAGDGPGVSVESSDPEVLEVALERECFCERRDDRPGRLEISEGGSCEQDVWRKRCDNRVLVQTLEAGDGDVVLFDADERVIDRAAVHVREASSAELSAVYADRLGSESPDALELQVGEAAELEARFYDGTGKKLLAPEGVTWRVDDGSVAKVTAWLIGSGDEVSAGLSVSVEALRTGETELEVEVPGLTARLPMAVTP